MTIAVQCAACGKRFKAKAEHAGKKARCPGCASPLTIPTPPAPSPATPALADLLDDELSASAAATATPAMAEKKPAARKCRQCGDELVEGSHYCLACGCNNRDVAGAVATTALSYDKRQQKLEAASRPRHWLLTWFMSGWFR